jgi:hypothetical protein
MSLLLDGDRDSAFALETDARTLLEENDDALPECLRKDRRKGPRPDRERGAREAGELRALFQRRRRRASPPALVPKDYLM